LTHIAEHSATSLPIDIVIETVVSTLVVILGLILSSPQPRPIQWRTWAGKIEREGAEGFRTSSGEVEKDFRGNPFMALESRQGFVDIRKQRREFADWAKGNQ
jgi:membrane magnesium transporter 1